MEILKKTILQAVTTGITACTGTTGTCYIIIPDTGVTYHFNIGLVQKAHDFGFFDAYIPPPLTKLTVSTSILNTITKTSAIGGGNITSDGGSPVIDRGVVYSINPNPTIEDSRTHNDIGMGRFISDISGLTIDTTYYIRAYAVNVDGLVYGDERTFKTLSLTTLITKPITEITTIGATSGGEIDSDGGNPITRRGIVWGTSVNPTLLNNYTINGYGIGSYDSYLTNLLTLTSYYVRAYITNMSETKYGNQISFMTIGLPTVTTGAMTLIKATTAIGNGNVTSEGGVTVTEKGIVWSTTPSPTIANNKVADGTGLGTFTCSIIGLVKTTTYYVRAYATNSVGTSYGNEVIFSTIDIPIVTTSPITSIMANSAIGGGNVTSDGGSPVTARGIQFGISSGTYGQYTIDGSGVGSYISNLSSLAATTTYYVRAYATNIADTSFGSEISFTTIAVVPPDITLINIMSIGINSAIIRAGITYSGTHDITERGVVWATFQDPDISLPTRKTSGSGAGVYETPIDGLVPNQKYYVRAYLYTVEDGYIYDDDEKFFTTSPPVAPTLGTFTVTDIEHNNAIGNSSVISDGGATASRGFVWSTTSNPTTADYKVTSGTGEGAFSEMMFQDIIFNTLYYARAYATNTAGTSYSNEVSFTTLPIAPVVSTQSVHPIGTFYATAHGTIENNGGAAVTARGFVARRTTGGYFIDVNAGVGDGVFYANLGVPTQLVPETEYFVKAYATNSIGTSYGGEASFTTSAIAPPVVTTVSIGTITTNSAIVMAGISYSGTHDIFERGVVWATHQMPDSTSNKKINGSGDGVYNTTITGLESHLLYYVRAYARTVEDGYLYGNQLSFTTLAPVPPTLGNFTVTDIEYNNAIGHSNVTSDGGATASRGFVWSTTPNPTTANSKVIEGTGEGAFSEMMWGMTFNTLYYARAYATNTAGTSYSNEVSFTTLPITPVVSTQAVSNIGSTYATGNGTIENNGGSPVTARGFVMGLSSGSYFCNINAGSGDGVFYANLGPLVANTTYYLKACATNSMGISYGGEASFTSLQIQPPVVTTVSIGTILINSAIVMAGISYSGTHDITERGVVWATYQMPDITSNKKINGSGDGVYNTTITGLVPNQLYYVRAYAYTAEEGFIYGNQLSFTTLTVVAPTLGTFTVTGIVSNSAIGHSNVTSDGGATASRGFVWSTTPNPTTVDYKVTSGTGEGAFSATMFGGMIYNTLYYARAYATNTAGTSYSNEVSFTTLPITPVVSTQSVYNIGSNYATGRGTVEHNGGATVTSRGFVMGLSSGSYFCNITADNGDVGSYYGSLGTLVANTTYYLRACATNSVGISCGSEASFTTLSIQPPVVTTIYVMNITTNSAIIRAGIAYSGSHTITERGVVWATYQMPDSTSNKKINGSGAGYYDTPITGLYSHQLYYVRAYAYTVEDGFIYGNQLSFTTN